MEETTKTTDIHEVSSLSNVPTYLLVSELEKRCGVSASYVLPYEDVTMTTNGPAVILVVID